MTVARRRKSRVSQSYRPGLASSGGLESLETRLLLTVLPEGFVETVVTAELSVPTAMELAPDGRVFVAQQDGKVKVIREGQAPETVLQLPVDNQSERGLVGLVLDPNFADNGYIYVYYTQQTTPARNRISRFEMHDDHIHPESETLILELDDLPSNLYIHNGGAMHFGPDGNLYVGVGDNAVAGSPQRLDHFGGKMLRIHPDGSIPSDNPFLGATSGKYGAIWAVGLRNPFTFGFDPATGRMFINDVGAGRIEEINEGRAGANYGWSIFEGPAHNPAYVDPFYSYEHNSVYGGACAITGGVFHSPHHSNYPAEYQGQYFFADFCGNWIQVLDPVTGAVRPFASETGRPPVGSDLGQLGQPPIDMDVNATGTLYYLTRNWQGEGQVRRIDYAPTAAPVVEPLSPAITVGVGQPALVSVVVSGALPLTYQWQRDEVDIPGANAPQYTLPAASLADSGARFRVVVSNAHGMTTSSTTTLTVVASRPPEATIEAPAEGSTYYAGATIEFRGLAIDPEEGPLPASALTWRVDFHHDDHAHPFLPDTTGLSQGSFTIPTATHDPGIYWYRITLKATDATGLSTTVIRDIVPGPAPVDPPGPIQGTLAPGRWSSGTTITRRQPVFQGTGPVGAQLVLVARNEATGAVVLLGRTSVNRRGQWRLNGRGLPNGQYAIEANWAERRRMPLKPAGQIWSADRGPLIVAVPPRRRWFRR